MTQRRLSGAGTTGLALGLVAGLVAGLVLASAPPAGAVGPADRLSAEVTVDNGDGRPVPLRDVDANQPLTLDPSRDVLVRLRVSNPGARPVVLRTVRLEGRVMGMTFFDYATRVDLTVDRGATVELPLPLDMSQLGAQATGLLPARLSLLDEDRAVLYQDPFPVAVQGSLWSTYGIFGLLVGAVTLVLLGAALVRLALRALPRHRWLRASRFAVPGLGLGLTLTFTLSVLRAVVPDADSWAATVVSGGLLGLLVGFVTPSPDVRRRREQADEREREQWAVPDEPAVPEDLAVAAPAGSGGPLDPDADRVIVLPDAGDQAAGAPQPRAPHDAGAPPLTDAALPPRPTRRR